MSSAHYDAPIMCDPYDENQPLVPMATPGEEARRSVQLGILYHELRALAQRELSEERPNHTLSATALVHEVYLKLSKSETASAAGGKPRLVPLDRAAFFGLAAQAMRRILIDHARTKRRVKRGGGTPHAASKAIDLVADPTDQTNSLDALALDEALSKLALEHEQAARVVELRFFAGLNDQMIGEVMQIDERTARRHWTFAKAWLARAMSETQDHTRSTRSPHSGTQKD